MRNFGAIGDGMPKKEKVKKDDKEQSQRLVETARRLEIDENGKSFDTAISIVTEKKKNKKQK